MPARLRVAAATDVIVTGNQVVGSTMTASLPKGGNVIFTRTPISGGATVDIGTAQPSPATYTVASTDRGYVIWARPTTTNAPVGLAIPTVAPLAPAISAIFASAPGTGALAVMVSRNADNGGDTVMGERATVYRASDNVPLATGDGPVNTTGLIPVTGVPPNVPVYVKVATKGVANGVGPQSAQSATLTSPPVNRAASTPSGGNNNGTMRIYGAQENIADPSVSSGSVGTVYYKVQAPSGAIGVRISVHHKTPVLGAVGVKVAVASTEISANDTRANAWIPQVGGVQYNVIAATSDKGFVKGKWNGATQSRRLFPSNAVMPSFGYNNQGDTVTSDFIPLVPKRVTDRPGDEYYYIFRLAMLTTPNQDAISNVTDVKNQAFYNSWFNSNGADTPMVLTGSGGSVDGVDGAISVTNPTAGPGTGTYAPAVSFEWTYPANITPVTFWHIGDSITEGYEWNRWAVNRKNTAQRPLHHVNLGGSTTRTESFIGNMYLHLQTMAKPDYVVMPMMSINNYSPGTNFTLAASDIEFTRLQEIAQFLTGLGIKIIWWTPINWVANPTNPADFTSSAWAKLYNLAKPYALANGIVWMDINGDPLCSRTVYNASTNVGGWIDPDNTHPSTPTGKAGFCRVYTDTLTALGF